MCDRKLVGSRQRSLSSRFSLSRRERPLLAGKYEGRTQMKKLTTFSEANTQTGLAAVKDTTFPDKLPAN